MPSYTVTITLGTGDKGKEWDRLVRFHARKNRQSIGAYVRGAVYDRIKREAPAPSAAQEASAGQTAVQ